MTWTDFYLICFVVGFAFSLLSFLAGGLHWHVHLPNFPQVHVGPHVHVGHVPTVGGHAGTASGAVPGHAGDVSVFNFVTLTAFLAWFGGTGYLLTRYSTVWFVMGLGVSFLAGLLGAAIVFLFLSRVLMSREENLDPADYDMVGVLGRISIPIRAAGTGEIIYSQAGTRRTCGARAEDGSAIAKGDDVIVTRYEKGIAYVRRWEDLAAEQPAVEMDGVDSAKDRDPREKETP
jgi:membrane protein implicated in regulation of membrane protease activity